MVNLTTSTYMFVLQGRLPLGEALSGLTGLKTLDIREHHISGGCRGRKEEVSHRAVTAGRL
jgi:hypothetical protein